MSLLRPLLSARKPPPSFPAWADPASYGSAEEYSYALMTHAVPTDTARAAISVALRRFSQQRDAQDAADHERMRRADRREAQREGAAIASRRMLREAGWQDEDEVPEPEPVAALWTADGLAATPTDPRYEVHYG